MSSCASVGLCGSRGDDSAATAGDDSVNVASSGRTTFVAAACTAVDPRRRLDDARPGTPAVERQFRSISMPAAFDTVL